MKKFKILALFLAGTLFVSPAASVFAGGELFVSEEPSGALFSGGEEEAGPEDMDNFLLMDDVSVSDEDLDLEALFSEWEDTDTAEVAAETAEGEEGAEAGGSAATDAEQTPTPDAEQTPAPDAELTPTPDAELSPTPDAELTPTPTPDAELTPTPDAELTPTPDAELTPTPDAELTPTPTAEVKKVQVETNEDMIRYDGKNHGHDIIKVIEPESDYMVYYSTTTPLTEENYLTDGRKGFPGVRDSGRYPVYYYITAEGYEPAVGVVNVTLLQIILTESDIVLEYDMAPYTGEEIKPSVTVTDPNGVIEGPLTEGKHYTVSYEDNIEPGKATVVVKGIGNYWGTLRKNFEIVKKTPQNITVTTTSAAFEAGKTFDLGAATDGDGALSFSSDNPSVAAVDEKGIVTMVAEGTANITITAAETDEYAESSKVFPITLAGERKSQTITAKGVNRVFVPGRKIQINASAMTALSFESLDPSICTVDENGVITMVSKGNTKVRIRAAKTDEYKAASKTISVKLTDKRVQAISTSRSAYRLVYKPNRIINFSAKAKGKISYASSDKHVFTINSKGTMTLQNPGIAYINITAKETSLYVEASAQIRVTVRPNTNQYTRCSSPSTGKLSLKWKRDTQASGYELQISTSSGFTSGRMSATAPPAQVATTVSNLKSGTRYYARIRSYTDYNGSRIYGAWSKVKSAVIK